MSKVTVIVTSFEDIPYYLKGVETKNTCRTVIWTRDVETAMSFAKKSDARRYMERENLYRQAVEMELKMPDAEKGGGRK